MHFEKGGMIRGWKKYTEQQTHRFIPPPPQENDEWHPEEGELNAQVDWPSVCKC